MKPLIIIPAYNEGERLKSLLSKLEKYYPSEDILVVDDGSNDSCCINLKEGIKVLRHAINSGKGSALKTGFEHAIREGYDWIITMDGDGQHDPARIPKFLDAAESGEYGIICGSRRKSFKGMPWDRRFSNLTTSAILSVISDQRIFDAQCGFRMYKAEFLKSVTILTAKFDTENELLLNAFRSKIKIGWVDIPTIYGGEDSHINRWQDTIKFIMLLWKYLIRKDY